MKWTDVFNTSRERGAVLAIVGIAFVGAVTGLDVFTAAALMGLVTAWACRD